MVGVEYNPLDGDVGPLANFVAVTESTGLPISPYVGYSYGQFDDHGRVIGGVNVNFNEWMQGQAIYDGQKVHPMLNFSFGRHQLGVLFAQGKNPGVSYSISF